MARIQVISERGGIVMDVVTDEEGCTFGMCRECGEEVTMRGDFQDTMMAAETHVDHQCVRRPA